MGTLYLFEVVLVYDTVRVFPIPHIVSRVAWSILDCARR
jgi:hypothetical protein